LPKMLTDTFFTGRKVLVTGASGFIGLPLTAALFRLGAQVCAVYRSEQRSVEGHVRWLQGDLEDLARTKEILNQEKPELVFHMAAHAWGSQDLSLVSPTFYGCLATTVNVLIASAEAGCRRIVLPGSLEEPLDPRGTPNSPYSAAKWASNIYGKMFHKLYGMEVIQTRIFMTYGPRQDCRKVIPFIITSLLKGNTLRLQSPERVVDWIYIDDVVSGILSASGVSQMSDLPVEIGSGIGMSIGKVAEKICRMFNTNSTLRIGEMPGRIEEIVRLADADNTFLRTGWRAKTPLEVGLLRTIEWYRERFQGNSRDGSTSSNGSCDRKGSNGREGD